MSKSLSYRHRQRNNPRISLTEKELKHGVAYRATQVCDLYYRVGDVRRVLNYCGAATGVRIRILSLVPASQAFRKGRRLMPRTKITFRKFKDSEEDCVAINMPSAWKAGKKEGNHGRAKK